MNYGFKSYEIKSFSSEEQLDKMPINFGIMMPQRAMTEEEMKKYAKVRLKDILDAYGVKFYQLL